MEKTLPIPYSAKYQEYEDFFESTSMLKSLMLANGLNNNWNLWNKLRTIYDMPINPIKPTHHHINDAFDIAYKTQIVLNINKYNKILN